jgi:hypothetical protein
MATIVSSSTGTSEGLEVDVDVLSITESMAEDGESQHCVNWSRLILFSNEKMFQDV